MKTEFLKGLGIEQEVIDKIMAENGRDIAAEQEKARTKLQQAESARDEYKAQLDAAKESLGKFDGVNVEDLKGQISQLQADLKAKDDEYAAREAERQFTGTLTEAIRNAGGRNSKAVMAMLDLDALRSSKDQTADIQKALDAVKESDAYLFGAGEPINNPVGPTGGGTPGNDSNAMLRAAMGLPAEK